MFNFIRSNYKKGDKLKLRSINGDFSGEILAVNESSIVLKTFDGKVCGIKDEDITFFEELEIDSQVESDLIDNANFTFKKKGIIRISYDNLYKANKNGDFGDIYYCMEYNNEIRINIDRINFTGKAKLLKKILESNYNKQCEFDVELQNSEKEYLNIKGTDIGLGIGEPRWWIVEILEDSFENPELLEKQLDNYYVLCYITIKKGKFQFVDDLYSKLKKR